MATITDVSLLANVSKATVSRVMSGSRGVKPESRDAVLRAAEQLNYRPNAAAQTLANKRSDYIGVILSSTDAGQVSTYLPLLAKALKSRGKHMLVQFAETTQEHQRLVDELSQRHCDAIISVGGSFASESDSRVIAVDSIAEDAESRVNYDYVFAAESACRFLSSKGHTSIAVVLDDEGYASEQVLQGYKQALQNMAIPVNRQLIVTANGSCEQAIMSLLNSFSQFSALVVMRDSQAAIAMNLFRSFNLATPQEVSIISLEDSQLASQLNPPLTCISYPSQTIIDNAMQKLDACLDDKVVEKTPLITGRLITRESVIDRN
ncbi:catabolite control protein A [Vibrio ishigakensis]|uniref:Catabolite control protein A n=1 Tax=Vibrio ishigakensis TaxID=1481914 RepID=A0A0B8PII6_9VIBR|nr:catabolite control protein A [Vibrio ishigakensis]